MKLIFTNAALKSNLLRLIKKYDYISFGTAWASAGTDVFAELVKAKAKIITGVIGTLNRQEFLYESQRIGESEESTKQDPPPHH